MTRVFTFAVVLAAIVSPIETEAQVPVATEGSATAVRQEQFQLSATERRHTFELPVERPGRVRVQAIWAGPAQRMEVSLFGPGETVRRARTAGASPLTIDFTVTEEQLRTGSSWVVAVSNRGAAAPVTGTAVVEYPASADRVARAALLAPDVARAMEAQARPSRRPPVRPPAAPSDPDPPPGIGADGAVETVLPDGSVRRSWIDRCGWETVSPDGVTTGVMCVEVVRTTLTDLPPGLLDDENLNGWLSELSPNLLEAVAAIVQDDEAVQNYLAFEGDRPLPARVDTRLRLLNLLLVGRSGGGQ